MWQKIKASKAWTWYTRWRLPLNVALLVLLFLGDCFWGGMVYIIYPVLLAMVCFDSFANAASYLVATIPFMALNGQLGYWFYLLCLFAVLVKFYIVIFWVDKFRPRPVVLAVLGAFLVYCLLPIGPYNQNLWLKTICLFAIFILFGVVIGKPAVMRFRLNVRLLAVALLLASMLGCLRTVIPHLGTVIPSYTAGDAVRFSALFGHPNNLALVCAITVSLLAYVIISRHAKIYDYLLLFAITALGLATLSKNCLVLMVVAYLIIFLWLLRHNWAPTVVVSCVVLTVVIGFCCIKGDFVTTYVGRFIGNFTAGDNFTDFMNQLTTYRWELWVGYSTYLWQHPLALFFGRGLGAGAVPITWHDQFMGPHNFYLAMIYQLGLVGTALFVAAIVLLIIELKKRRPHAIHKAVWVPVLILLLLLSVEDFILHIVA